MMVEVLGNIMDVKDCIKRFIGRKRFDAAAMMAPSFNPKNTGTMTAVRIDPEDQ